MLKLLIAALFCAVLVMGTPFDYSIIDESNADPEVTFKSGMNDNFGPKASVESIRRLMGWKPTGKRLPEMSLSSPRSLPTTYSVATAFPECASCQSIQNQGECGSCWAFGAVSSFTDRVWIHSNGSMAPIQLSEQQMTSCASGCDGCSGCDAGPAYEYIQKTGLTTGGQTPFSSPAVTAAGGSSFPQECYPYTQPTCAESQQPCLPNTFKPTIRCTLNELNSTCTGLQQVFKASKIYAVPSNFEAHAQEIYSFGSIEMCFTVYNNFVTYKSGIYNKASGGALGGHCVRCIGFGTQNGVNYLTCANSWTPAWGNNGYFDIEFGVAGAGQDSVAGIPSSSLLL